MIKQYQLLLKTAEGDFLHPYSAYWLYSLLVKCVSPEFANQLHEPTFTPFTQYVTRTLNPNEVIWRINLFGENTIKEISSLIDAWDQLQIERLQSPVTIIKKDAILFNNVDEMLLPRQEQKTFYTMHFGTPTTFKSEGEYMLFPSSRLILQSLLNKWNALYPELSMRDEDAVQMLNNGIRIRNYKLHSTQYPLSGLKLPGFLGYVELQVRLSEPLHELWHLLYSISPYTGVGIKTALGMGAVMIKF